MRGATFTPSQSLVDEEEAPGEEQEELKQSPAGRRHDPTEDSRSPA